MTLSSSDVFKTCSDCPSTLGRLSNSHYARGQRGGHLPHCPVEAVRTEAMSTLGLEGSSQYVVAAVAQVLVLQLVTQDLLGEAGLVALHG